MNEWRASCVYDGMAQYCRLGVLVVWAASVLAAPALAQRDDEANAGETRDVPGRVGRFSFIEGNVSLKPAAAEQWLAAIANRPLTTGDQIWVDEGARAEVHIGGLAIRFDSSTAARLAQVDDDVVQFSVSQGEVEVTAQTFDSKDQVGIDLPNGSVRLRGAGKYVVSFEPERAESRVTARSGEVEVAVLGRTIEVDAGQRATLMGETSVQPTVAAASAENRFEQWASERDQREAKLAASRYVSREMTGYDDLDDNGTWSTASDFGSIWFPKGVAADWAPYRYGHWSYIAPWGWTWIDDASWGFAPFHYGRWVSWQGRWGWCPGRMVGRPFYAPALVAWVGGVTAGVAIGASIGWFPLGPREVYVPSYRYTPRYLTQVNVMHVQVTNAEHDVNRVHYVNRGAYVVVPHETFAGARPVAPAVIAAPAYASAPVVRAVAVAPRRQSAAPAAAVRSGPTQPAFEPPPRHIAPPVRVAPPPFIAPRPSVPAHPAAPPQRVAPAPYIAPRPSMPARPAAPPQRVAPAPNVAPQRSAPARPAAPPANPAPPPNAPRRPNRPGR